MDFSNSQNKKQCLSNFWQIQSLAFNETLENLFFTTNILSNSDLQEKTLSRYIEISSVYVSYLGKLIFWKKYHLIKEIYIYLWSSTIKITRKSGHKCASLTCITWTSCNTYITCTTEISYRVISWDIIDIAGILVRENVQNLFCSLDGHLCPGAHLPRYQPMASHCSTVCRCLEKHF